MGLVVIHALIFGVAPRPPPAPLVSTGCAPAMTKRAPPAPSPFDALGVVCEGTETISSSFVHEPRAGGLF